jgi:hypothetical protein
MRFEPSGLPLLNTILLMAELLHPFHGKEGLLRPSTFNQCNGISKYSEMQLQWGSKSIHTAAQYHYPKGIFASAKYWRMGGGSAYLRKPVTQEEGGPFRADFTKVYTTRSSTTSSEITPENKCDHIHLLASLHFFTTLFTWAEHNWQ